MAAEMSERVEVELVGEVERCARRRKPKEEGVEAQRGEKEGGSQRSAKTKEKRTQRWTGLT